MKKTAIIIIMIITVMATLQQSVFAEYAEYEAVAIESEPEYIPAPAPEETPPAIEEQLPAELPSTELPPAELPQPELQPPPAAMPGNNVAIYISDSDFETELMDYTQLIEAIETQTTVMMIAAGMIIGAILGLVFWTEWRPSV